MQFILASNIVYNAIQQHSPTTQFVLGGFTTISLRLLAGCNGLVDSFYDDDGNLYSNSDFEENCSSTEVLNIVNRISYVLDNAMYDEVDIHLYDDVEQWAAYFNNFKTLVNKPIIVTEFGGPNLNIEPNTEAYQAEKLSQYIKTIDSLNIPEAYFFKLVEGTNNPAHAKSGLIDTDNLEKKESFFIFKELNKK